LVPTPLIFLGTGPPCKGLLKSRKKPLLNPALNPWVYLHTHQKSRFFSVIENPFYLDKFCPLGDFLRLFLRREITIKARALFHLPYPPPCSVAAFRGKITL
jgi:hypothetical protein